MDAFGQPRFFQKQFQLDLPPVALGFVVPFQRTGEVIGIRTQLMVQFPELFDLFFQADPVFGLFDKAFFYSFFERLDLFAQGFEDMLQLLLVLQGELLAFFFQQAVGEVLEFQAGAFL